MATLGENLLRYKKKQKYLIWDTETEGLNLYLSRPWQLAYATYIDESLVKARDIYVRWPNLQVSKRAAEITRFSYEKYDRVAIDPVLALDEFEKYLYDPEYLILGQNLLGYDIYIHNTWRRLCGRPSDYSYLYRVYDTNCLAKAMKKEMKVGEENHFRFQWKLTNFYEKGMKTSLGALCKEFEIPVDENKQHDALYDIDINKKVFDKLKWNYEI